MTVRLYHDARMAEVINSQNTGALEPLTSIELKDAPAQRKAYGEHLFS